MYSSFSCQYLHTGPPELRLASSSSIIRAPIVFARLHVFGKQVKVNFDGESHASGPRCYANCPKHGSENCRKYEFIHNHASLVDCVLSLAGWQMAAVRTEGRADHVPCKATNDELDRARQHLPAFL